MRLERRNGPGGWKKVAVRKGTGKGGAGGGASKGLSKGSGECFRCGRQGHLRANCTWSTHLDGGKPRPPPKRELRNLEEESPAPTPSTADITALPPLGGLTIELNMMEDDDEMDPWAEGSDPWGSAPDQSDLSDEDFLCGLCDPMIPTLKDLYSSRDVCKLCAETGLYEKVIKAQKAEQYFLSRPPPAPLAPSAEIEPKRAPIPKWIPHIDSQCIRLSACIPEPPERDELPEVLDWDHSHHEFEKVGFDEENVDGFQGECGGIEFLDCLDKSTPAFLIPDLDEHVEFYDCPDELTSACQVPDVIEINAIDDSHERIDITVDSGAGAPVCHPKHFPASTVVDSPGSLAGQNFAGPGGELIPNQGQLKADTILENGLAGKFTFQAADIRSPLLAVSSVNDKGNLVLFDPAGSFIIPAHNQELIAEMRKLVKRMTGKVDLHRKNGVYRMTAWRQKSGFTRQGR